MIRKKIICPNCSYPNTLKSSFCKNCGDKIPAETKDAVIKKTIYYKLELVKKWYDHLTLSTITSHPFFRACIIGLILGYGGANLIFKGSNIAIEKDTNYDIIYSEKLKEYYLIVPENIDKVPINLYIPSRLDNMDILHYREDGVLLESEKYKEDEKIYLTTYDEDYFILNASYLKTDKETALKVYIYNEDKVNLEGVQK